MWFLPARRYASTGTSYIPFCESVCPSVSVTSRFSIETGEQIDLVCFWGDLDPNRPIGMGDDDFDKLLKEEIVSVGVWTEKGLRTPTG